MPEVTEARQVKEQHKQSILQKPNVVGVGVGYKRLDDRVTSELSVLVLVRRKVPLIELRPEAVVPPQVNGIPTDVIQVGDLRALQAPTDRWRPAPGGVSIGHYQITAGTLGVLVRDRATGQRLILSNNHVLANSNSANPGDAILQPGPYDGGQVSRDTIAHLERFVPIQFGVQPGTCGLATTYAAVGNVLARLAGSNHRVQVYQANPQAVNQVDAAVARPLSDDLVSDEILEIGTVTGTAPATLGMPVRKSGRTTGFTTGEISVIDATVNVSYGPMGTATFDHQLVAGPISQGGDSGSLVVDGDSLRAVGLLFAGSEQSTIFSPIQYVLDSLEVELMSATAGQASPAGTDAERVQAVKQAYESELLSKPNVVGVGVGYRETGGTRTGDMALVVMVDKKVPEEQLSPRDIIPRQIEGVPVDVQVIGQPRAF